ncbi:hypothetical protein Hesp01_27040 [Herbidospora sp. NBRC 101105]|nr:hypothetical protein Hesp01_27040 [Herbidospora sp. NBRC 101105]
MGHEPRGGREDGLVQSRGEGDLTRLVRDENLDLHLPGFLAPACSAPLAGSGSISVLEPRDGLWAHRFAAEPERVGDDGVPRLGLHADLP